MLILDYRQILYRFSIYFSVVLIHDLFLRLQDAYYAVCERQLAKFQHELAVEQVKRPNDDLEDLERQAAALAAKIKAAKTRLGLDASPEKGEA